MGDRAVLMPTLHAAALGPCKGWCKGNALRVCATPILLWLGPTLRTPAGPKPRVAAPSGPPGGGLRRSSRSEAELTI